MMEREEEEEEEVREEEGEEDYATGVPTAGDDAADQRATPAAASAAVSATRNQGHESPLQYALMALGYTVVIGAGTFFVRTAYPIDGILRLRITYVKPARQVQYIGAFCLGVWAARRRLPLVRPAPVERAATGIAGASLAGFLVLLSRIQHRTALVTRLRGGWTAHSLLFSLAETAISFLGTTGAVSMAERLDADRERGRLRAALGASAYGVYITHYFVVTALQTVVERLRPQMPASLKWVVVTGAALPLSFGVSILVRRIPGVHRVL
jgi:peptidoglycan/LPS O-acetylase OafA/YrhL